MSTFIDKKFTDHKVELRSTAVRNALKGRYFVYILDWIIFSLVVVYGLLSVFG